MDSKSPKKRVLEYDSDEDLKNKRTRDNSNGNESHVRGQEENSGEEFNLLKLSDQEYDEAFAHEFIKDHSTQNDEYDIQPPPPPPPPPSHQRKPTPPTHPQPSYSTQNLPVMKSYSAPPKPYSDSYRNDSEGNKIVKIRALISTKEAGVVIGVKGSHVAEIREATGMRIMVTPHIQNVPDRVMTLSGPLGSLGVAMAMIVTKLLSRNEPNEESEDTVTLRILVPSTRMGFVIGKSGARIKELQANSGAKMYSQNENLPNSTERVMTMIGNADSLQIACYSLAAIIGDQHERPESAMQMLYDPGNALRQPYGMPTNAMYGQSAKGYGGQGNPGYNAQMYNYPQGQNSAMYASYYPQMQMMAQYPHLQAQYQQQYYAAAQAQTDGVSENGQPTPRSTESQTQELTIPNNLVGAIIGKGGSKVKEIRNASGSQIKFADPVEGATDRIVWVTGLPESNARAIYMLHARVEAEKARYAAYPNNHKSH